MNRYMNKSFKSIFATIVLAAVFQFAGCDDGQLDDDLWGDLYDEHGSGASGEDAVDGDSSDMDTDAESADGMPANGEEESLLGETGILSDWLDAIENFGANWGSESTTERYGLPPLETVPYVDLNRYTGTWYEIASFPQGFQDNCTGTTATYSLNENGEIDVVNRCTLGSLDGEEDIARGTARVMDDPSNAKLEVSFFKPFWGPYWIIDLDENYAFAVVGHPGRDYLWILSRTPSIDADVYNGIIERLIEKDYQLDRLEKTVQPANR